MEWKVSAVILVSWLYLEEIVTMDTDNRIDFYIQKLSAVLKSWIKNEGELSQMVEHLCSMREVAASMATFSSVFPLYWAPVKLQL